MTKKRYILILILIIVLGFIDCFADGQTIKTGFKSKNGLFLLKPTEINTDTLTDDFGRIYFNFYNDVKWGLFNTTTNKLKYEIPGPISTMTAYISGNGRYIVIVNDYPYKKPDDSLDLIHIYDNGELIKLFNLSDLLNCGYNISKSVGHFQWIYGKCKVNFMTMRIVLQTTELVDYKINIRNGEILEKKRNPNITDNSILAYGEVFGEANGKYRLEVCHKVYGQVDTSGVVLFRSDFMFQDGSSYTVLINDAQEIRLKIGPYDIHNLILNSCTFKYGTDIKPIEFGNINCE